MRNLDDTIGIVAYILDTLMAYRQIVQSGDCNSCGNKTCKHRPKLGELVRYNCPHFTHTVTIRIDDEVTE